MVTSTSLVSKGLNPLVQKALDVVRVIGNESVHPGEIDLNDNKEVAMKLFGLVNLITEQMICHPKHVERLYSGLPDSKLRRIEQCNAKAKVSNQMAPNKHLQRPVIRQRWLAQRVAAELRR